jgi:hypothetical protein
MFVKIDLYIKGGTQATVFQNRSRGKYLCPEGMRMGSGEVFIVRNFIVYAVHLI